MKQPFTEAYMRVIFSEKYWNKMSNGILTTHQSILAWLEPSFQYPRFLFFLNQKYNSWLFIKDWSCAAKRHACGGGRGGIHLLYPPLPTPLLYYDRFLDVLIEKFIFLNMPRPVIINELDTHELQLSAGVSFNYDSRIFVSYFFSYFSLSTYFLHISTCFLLKIVEFSFNFRIFTQFSVS